ncbi:MAG: hypothetical protein CBD97_02030 [Pelagibacteraceae bacterium TMED237]|nr:MAG: hypothetical protein CBD97_02030 [Pelagibacteraceae bacterium TMED237]
MRKFSTYEIVSICLVSALFFLIIGLIVWASLSSVVKNCCKNETTFVNCKKYFGTQANMNDETYEEVCNI